MNLLSTLDTDVDRHCKFFAQLHCVLICNNLEPTFVTYLCHLHFSNLLHRKKIPSTYVSVRHRNLIVNIFITFSLQHVCFECHLMSALEPHYTGNGAVFMNVAGVQIAS